MSEEDDLIPQTFQQNWNKWMTKLERVADFMVKRCIKPKGFGRVASALLRHFSYASENGYDMVSYLRMQNFQKTVHVAFDKARVAPLKSITIACLELTVAVVAVRVEMQNALIRAAAYVEEVKWIDSTLSTSMDNSNVSQWRHVPALQIPAFFTNSWAMGGGVGQRY